MAGFFFAATDCLGWWTVADTDDFGDWYRLEDDAHPVNLAHAYGWDRQPPALYDWEEPARDPWGRPSDWGPWYQDDAAMLLRSNSGVTTDLFRCLTAGAIMRNQLTIAPNIDSLALGGLIRAIDNVLGPASWRRPFGADRGIDINGVAEHVDRYINFYARDRAQPTWQVKALSDVTVSPYEAAREIGAWEPTVIQATIERDLPSIRVADSVRVHMDDVRQWAARPGTDLSTPAEHSAWIDDYRQRWEGEEACARAALAFLTTAAPWTGSQADLHAAITPDPVPPAWPAAAQLINILSRQFLPQPPAQELHPAPPTRSRKSARTRVGCSTE